MVFAFGLIGVPEDGALVLGFLMGIIGVVVAVPGGILWALGREKGETLTHPGTDLPLAAEQPEQPGPGGSGTR
jgi:hypothetical protein